MFFCFKSVLVSHWVYFIFESELINDLTGLNAVQVTLNRRVCQLYQCKCIVNRSYSKDQRLYNFEFKNYLFDCKLNHTVLLCILLVQTKIKTIHNIFSIVYAFVSCLYLHF